MEVAGGAIGAASLGIQLISTVQKIIRFIQDIRDAPEELANLRSSVERFCHILRAVTTLIESRRLQTGNTGSVDLLESAVSSCHPNVAKLEKLVDDIRRKLGHDSRRRMVWASMMTVIKKDDLDKHRRLVEGDLVALNTAIAVGAYELK